MAAGHVERRFIAAPHGAYFVALFYQFTDDIGSEEAGAAGDKYRPAR